MPTYRTLKRKPTGTLRDWAFKNGRLTGKLYDHVGRWPDGHELDNLPPVRRAWTNGRKRYIATQSNTYRLSGTGSVEDEATLAELIAETTRKHEAGGSF